MDMDYEPYMLVEGRKAMENPPSQSLHQKLLAEAFNMNGRRILASKNKPPTLVVEDPIPLFSSSSSTSFHPSRPVKPQRQSLRFVIVLVCFGFFVFFF
jgi:cell division cycle protein 20 (cofactor of APC complex)